MMDDIWGQNTLAASPGDTSAGKVTTIEDTVREVNRDDHAVENDPWWQLVLLMADNKEGNEELRVFRELLNDVNDVNDMSRTGVALIHYTIVYDHAPYIELLHQHGRGLDLNLLDCLVGFSPLMWCIHLNRQNCCTELFSFIDEINFDKPSTDGLRALDLVVPGSLMAEFLDQTNVSQYQQFSPMTGKSPSDSVELSMTGLNLETESSAFATSNRASNEFTEEFDFDRMIKNQYLEFSDYDIPQILDLLISLPSKNPHCTTYPAALLFQCIRYADHKLDSIPLVESLIHLSLTRIIATVSTDLNSDLESQGDIVIQSYWLSAVSFLYYYLCRDEAFFRRYPAILQNIINTLHTLLIEINSAIHSRVVPLMDSTILSYTTIEDVKQTLYKRDWNFFKKRKQAKQLALQEKRKNDTQFFDNNILKHLYPPSLEDQMKASPMKVVQVFGALSYVLDLHRIHPLFQQQCLSIAIDWFSSTLFNKMLKDKKRKVLSRAHAIQIRLNLSSLETWIRNNDLTVPKPMLIDSFMWERFPYTLISDLNDIDLSHASLRNVARYRPINGPNHDGTPVVSDTTNSLFYYQPFHQITRLHLEPVFQLLQWLQVATTLTSDESLDATLVLLPRLKSAQLLKAIEKYSYEVDEHKFNSALKKRLSQAAKAEKSKDDLYLPERQTPLLVLPTTAELTDTYTRGANSRYFQPLLPIEIQDSALDIHEENFKIRRNEPSLGSRDTTENDQDNNEHDYSNVTNGEGEADPCQSEDGRTADEYFKELNSPLASVQRHPWGANDEIEANPW